MYRFASQTHLSYENPHLHYMLSIDRKDIKTRKDKKYNAIQKMDGCYYAAGSNRWLIILSSLSLSYFIYLPGFFVKSVDAYLAKEKKIFM